LSLLGEDVKTFLVSKGVTAPIITEGDVPEMPDRVLVITMTGGPGESGERTRDNVAFQIRTRGKQGIPGDGGSFARDIDDVLLGAVPPLQMGTRRAIRILRFGGPPSYLLRDPGNRVHHVCNYLVEVTRTVH